MCLHKYEYCVYFSEIMQNIKCKSNAHSWSYRYPNDVNFKSAVTNELLVILNSGTVGKISFGIIFILYQWVLACLQVLFWMIMYHDNILYSMYILTILFVRMIKTVVFTITSERSWYTHSIPTSEVFLSTDMLNFRNEPP